MNIVMLVFCLCMPLSVCLGDHVTMFTNDADVYSRCRLCRKVYYIMHFYGVLPQNLFS